jgi:hypothetical protein
MQAKQSARQKKNAYEAIHMCKAVLLAMVMAAQTRIDIHGSLQFRQEMMVEEAIVS